MALLLHRRIPRPYRILLYIVTGAIVYQIVAFLLLSGSSSSPSDQKVKCQVSTDIQESLRYLLRQVDHVLETLKLSHVLCYNTLWGSINMGNLLPWQDTAEYCIFNEEILNGMDEGFLARSFFRHNLTLVYDSGYGVYTVKEGHASRSKLLLYVFEKDTLTGMMRRVGWRHRLLPPDCESSPSLFCFPPRLVATPLPRGPMADMKLPVPHESIELQKYLFPDSWWKDQKPEHC